MKIKEDNRSIKRQKEATFLTYALSFLTKTAPILPPCLVPVVNTDERQLARITYPLWKQHSPRLFRTAHSVSPERATAACRVSSHPLAKHAKHFFQCDSLSPFVARAPFFPSLQYIPTYTLRAGITDKEKTIHNADPHI